MYAYPGGGNTRRTRIPDDALQYVDADDIYELAEELFEFARELMAASVRLPAFWTKHVAEQGGKSRAETVVLHLLIGSFVNGSGAEPDEIPEPLKRKLATDPTPTR